MAQSHLPLGSTHSLTTPAAYSDVFGRWQDVRSVTSENMAKSFRIKSCRHIEYRSIVVRTDDGFSVCNRWWNFEKKMHRAVTMWRRNMCFDGKWKWRRGKSHSETSEKENWLMCVCVWRCEFVSSDASMVFSCQWKSLRLSINFLYETLRPTRHFCPCDKLLRWQCSVV